MTALCLKTVFHTYATHRAQGDSAVDAHRHTGTPCPPQVLSLLLFWDAQWCFIVRVLSVLCPTVTALSFLLESVFLEFITALFYTSILFFSCLIFLATCLPLNFVSALKISPQSVWMCQKFYHFKLIFEREWSSSCLETFSHLQTYPTSNVQRDLTFLVSLGQGHTAN